jgi:hypothetical protein
MSVQMSTPQKLLWIFQIGNLYALQFESVLCIARRNILTKDHEFTPGTRLLEQSATEPNEYKTRRVFQLGQDLKYAPLSC